LEIPYAKEKMVPHAHYHSIDFGRCSVGLFRWVGRCAIHLHFVLTMLKEVSKERVFETALVLSAACVVFYLIYDWRPLLLIALAFAAVALFVKPLGRLVAFLWFELADVLGKVMPSIVLGLVYFVFLVPFALISKLSKKDGLQLKRKAKGESYWIERKHTYTKEDIENLW